MAMAFIIASESPGLQVGASIPSELARKDGLVDVSLTLAY